MLAAIDRRGRADCRPTGPPSESGVLVARRPAAAEVCNSGGNQIGNWRFRHNERRSFRAERDLLQFFVRVKSRRRRRLQATDKMLVSCPLGRLPLWPAARLHGHCLFAVAGAADVDRPARLEWAADSPPSRLTGRPAYRQLLLRDRRRHDDDDDQGGGRGDIESNCRLPLAALLSAGHCRRASRHIARLQLLCVGAERLP
jgi:hypothetical protein